MNSPKIIKHVEYRHLLDEQVPIASYDLFEDENNRYAFVTFFNASLYCVRSFKIKFIYFDDNKEKISEDVYSFQPELLISHRRFKPVDPIVMPKNAAGFNYEIFDVDIPDKDTISHQSLRLQAVPKDATLSLGKAKVVKAHPLNKVSTIFCLVLLVLASAFLCVRAGLAWYLADNNSYLYFGNFTRDGIKYKTVDDGYVEIVQIDCDKAIQAARDNAREEFEKAQEELEKESTSSYSSSTKKVEFDESSVTTITIASTFTDDHNNTYTVRGFNSNSIIKHTTFTGDTQSYTIEFDITSKTDDFNWTTTIDKAQFAISPFYGFDIDNLVINFEGSSGTRRIPEGLFDRTNIDKLRISNASSIQSYAFIKADINILYLNYYDSSYCVVSENANLGSSIGRINAGGNVYNTEYLNA